MSAFVETMAWLRAEGAPWHGLGTVMEEVPQNGAEAMKMAGLDWEVATAVSAALVPNGIPVRNSKILSTLQLAYPGLDGEFSVIDGGNQYVIRKDNGRVLGLVGPRYEPMQNEKAFEFFDQALGVGKAQYVTAGSLKGGKVIWALVRLPGFLQVGEDDVIGKYLLLTTAHDGSMAVWLKITPIRVVCWNTLHAAFEDSKTVARFWHTKGVNDRVFDYANQLAAINDIYEKTEKAFQALAEHQVTAQQVETYIETLFPIKEEVSNPTRTENIRKSVLNRFEGQGMGADLKSSKGTAWGLYNATCEWVDHERGSASNRLHAAWVGAGDTLKKEALELSLGMLAN